MGRADGGKGIKEKQNISVTAYFDEQHRPICALNLSTGDICCFLRASNFGLVYVCKEYLKNAHAAAYVATAAAYAARASGDKLDFGKLADKAVKEIE